VIEGLLAVCSKSITNYVKIMFEPVNT